MKADPLSELAKKCSFGVRTMSIAARSHMGCSTHCGDNLSDLCSWLLVNLSALARFVPPLIKEIAPL